MQRWAEPRFTHDADMTLLTGVGGEEAYVDTLLGRYRPRQAGERDFALVNRVLRLQSDTDVPLDIALGALDFEERSIARATPWPSREAHTGLITCSADDLIVHKSFAGRDRDWLDVEAIVLRQGPKLNVGQIWQELRPLVELKEAPEILTKLQRIFDEHLGS